MNKYLLVVLFFFFGYGLASYQFSRIQLADEIDDYQREISVAIRLLDEYSQNCSSNNFSAYVEHATTMYGNLTIKANGFPYFFSREFIDDHAESAFNFRDKIKINQSIAAACK
jgi:hypothetical protein